MRILILALLLTGCATQKTCEQLAFEAAGQAMSNVQYNQDRYNDYQMMIACSSANGCLTMPLKSGYDTGMTSGQYSQTGYRGLNSRQAYEKTLSTCK
jgi:hypothetical protein